MKKFFQLLFFLFIPSVYASAFAGVKYIFIQMGKSEMIELTSFVEVLVVICIYTMIFGRFFCGYACAFGTLGDVVRALYVYVSNKFKKKPIQLGKNVTARLSCVKYIVLVGIVLMCYGGVSAKIQGTSPWDVFSMLYAGNFRLDGYEIGFILLVLIVAGMCVQERFFCRFLCPMGAVFSLLPVLPFFHLHRDMDNCIKGCGACTKICPSDVELPDTGKLDVMGDCFQCQKCIDICPKENIHCGISRLKGNEVWFTVLRVFILLGICRIHFKM